jgi:DNA-binding winged helix-turn-helix (wHTH) protein/tetratricopeptide (TPR) repeat protein/TolB-like protein
MAASSPAIRSDKVYEFNDFRVDPVRRRLFRHGELVPLTPKAFSILLVLLENRGGVVDKEELIRRIWPDTYVTEANLTQNISSLRKALGERANEHRYVVTVPGQGYSFVADVVEVLRDPTGELPIVSLAAASSTVPAGPPVAPPPGEAAPPAPEGERTPPAGSLLRAVPGRRRFLLVGLVLGFLIAVAVAGLLLLYRGGRTDQAGASADPPIGVLPAAAIRPTVAVLALRNLSADPRQDWLATALSEMLITELSTGSRVRLITGEEIARVRKSPTAPASQVDLRQVHERLGADLAVMGSYLPLAVNGEAKIRIDLRVVKLPDGDILRTLSEVGTEEKLFDLVSRVGRRLRGSLGWVQPTPEEVRATAALQPANSEAARLYAQGLDRLRAYDSQGASDLLQKAVEADPRSAIIRSALSLAWINLGHDEQARQEAATAVQLAAALPKVERLAIEARLQEVKRDWNKASDIYRSLWTFYPDNLEYGLRLTNSLSIAGRNSEALAMVAALRQPPRWREDPRIDLVAAQIYRRLDDPKTELKLATAAADKGSRLGEDPVVAEAMLLQGDPLNTLGSPWEAVQRFRQAQELFTASGNHAAVARTLNRIGASLLMTSDFPGAEKVYQEALAIAHRLGSAELVAAQTMGLGFAAEYRGDLERARSLAEQSHDQFVEMGEHLYETRSLFGLADVLWEMGDAKEARRRFEEVLSLARRSDNHLEESRALDGIGRALVAAGSLREAGQYQQAAFQKTQFRMFAATAEASLGQTLMLQGDLAGARQHLESALAIKRGIRDRMGTSQVLGLLARLAYAEGDLKQAQRCSAEQRQLAEQIQADLLVAAALQQEGRLAMAAGELPKARELLSRALRICESRHAEWLAAGLRLDLSRLALLQERPADAVREASALASWFNSRGMVVHRTRALSLLSQGLLATGNGSRAQEVGNQARSLAEDSEDRELQIEVVSSIAAVALATGEAREVLNHLKKAVATADRSGMVTAGLEARLALAAVQIQTGDAITGRATLEAVRRNAADRGLTLLARRAAALLGGRRLPLG